MSFILENIRIDRDHSRSIYLQISDSIVGYIKAGKISPGARLPGSRKLAHILDIHRKTVLAAFEELHIQGWIETLPAKGTFVSSDLPIVRPTNLRKTYDKFRRSGFHFNKIVIAEKRENAAISYNIRVNEGTPDVRLAPMNEICKIYRNISKRKYLQPLLEYGPTHGNKYLREVLVDYLEETRGLRINLENLMITRGSQMGIYLASRLLLRKGDKVAVGMTNYRTSDETFLHNEAELVRIRVDKDGLDTDHLSVVLKSEKIKALYITSHHHHPTTVTLSAERRMQITEMARFHGFAVIEDDYDYDFHYAHAPILPLASSDGCRNVIYVGGLTKIIAPTIRVGYMIGPPDFIAQAAELRRFIDRQGDNYLEHSLAQFIQNGDIHRHVRKARNIYRERRDYFCNHLKELKPHVLFDIPDGGMAVWVRLNCNTTWKEIIENMLKLGVFLDINPERYDVIERKQKGVRIGYASLNFSEIDLTLKALRTTLINLTSAEIPKNSMSEA